MPGGCTFAVIAVFALAALSPAVARLAGARAGWLLSLLPAALTGYFAWQVPGVSEGATLLERRPWVPGLGVELSFYLDGLGLLFALLVCGIGTIVVLYSGDYLASRKELERFYPLLLFFMGSMLGLVLAGDIITLYVFWELTSLSSFLLIGFEHERTDARAAALQALLVTVMGGLALLAGLILLGLASGTTQVTELLAQGESLREHRFYLAALLLLLVGAFTKSAQVPFHFWLPNAMEAPTPVSAYLHSATMVKAGVYLLARFSPVLGETSVWLHITVAVGALTMVCGALLALVSRDLKRVLAYSTISALGMLVLLVGVGTPTAVKAAMAQLLAHALYKGALFLVAGAVDHQTGTRDVDRLGGLASAMPGTALAALLAGLSMAGLPPALGFVAKEVAYEAASGAVLGALVGAGALLTATAALVTLRPFLAGDAPDPRTSEAPLLLWAGPLVLGLAGLVSGIVPRLVDGTLTAPAAMSVLTDGAGTKLALWHGLTPALGLSVVSLVAGMGLYGARPLLRAAWEGLRGIPVPTPGRCYDFSLQGLDWLAKGLTRALQSGYLRAYTTVTVLGLVALVGATLALRGSPVRPVPLADLRIYELMIPATMFLAALVAATSTSRLAAVAAMGAVGYGVALIYLLFGAPDLAMTQVLVETLAVVLFVLVFYHLPRFARLSSTTARLRDAVIALGVGGLMTVLLLAATALQFSPPISDFYAENSRPLAHGRNVVNVIVVDFRGLDTLGEITVLALAGIGVYALLRLRGPRE
jgi:multicomponent Na+:H+ antiporter subunit A